MMKSVNYSDTLIDYKVISDALEYYQRNGFTYIEIPWTVSEDTSDALRQADRESLSPIEQNLLFLVESGKLSYGKYVFVYPQRGSVVGNSSEKPYSMEVALIHYSTEPEPFQLRDAALGFFDRYFVNLDHFLEDGVEIVVGCPHMRELGYYYRVQSYNGCRWAFGTGLSEPGFSATRRIEKDLREWIKSFGRVPDESQK